MYEEVNRYAAGQSPAAPKPPTPFHQLSGTHERVRDLCGRVQKLAAALVGEVPPAGSDAKVRSSSCGGVIGIVEGSAADLDHEIAVAGAAIDRIERQLP